MDASDHIYIHVPFCDGKCAYCVFHSEPLAAENADRFLEAVERELAQLPAEAAPLTIYFGGGTPSILDTPKLARLCNIILDRVSTGRLVEWTVEANPGTLPPDKIRMLRGAGVNRVSIGAQSFDNAVLAGIGRRHDADAVAHTLELVRTAGIDNIGLDLIACLPGVSDDLWNSTLRSAVELEPDHVSVYALTVEPGSAFSLTGVPGPDDAAVLNALGAAGDILADAGYHRYEISNHCRPGRECAHNLSCWRGEDYLGFGPAASSRAGLRRWTNHADTGKYCRALSAGEMPPRNEEELTARSDATERLIFAFRLSEGVTDDSLRNADAELTEYWHTALKRIATEELAERIENGWRLTERGRALADHVAGELIP